MAEQDAHTELLMKVTNIESNILHMKEMFEVKVDSYDKHLVESEKVRMQIHDNTKFRQGGVKALWFAIAGIIGSFIRFEFFKN